MGLSPLQHFQCCSFGHSDTSPRRNRGGLDIMAGYRARVKFMPRVHCVPRQLQAEPVLVGIARLRYNLPMAERTISVEQVQHIAKLARLAMTRDQANRYREQLEHILHYVHKIAEPDLSLVEPLAHPLALKNVLREDVAGAALPLEAVLQNAPDADGRFFKVPKIIGGDEDSAG